MKSKKTNKGDLERKRTTFELIGIVLVLGLVYVGFELFATQDSKTVSNVSVDYFELVDEAVPITDKTPPPPPPMEPRKEYVMNVVDDAIKNNEDWRNLLMIEYNFDDVIDPYTQVDIIEVAVEPPPPEIWVDVMPEFVGGEKAMYAFLQKNLSYPQSAREIGIQGVVLVEFVVERDGKVTNVKTAASLSPDCDQEAMRVVKMLPDFIPGKKQNKTVRVLYRLPIKFSLVN